MPAIKTAPTVNCQKYFFTIAFARSWNRHSKKPTIAKRPVLKIADTPKNSSAEKPIKPAHIAISLYGIGVTAVIKMIKIPCLINILCANSNFSMVAKFSISHTPTVSNSQSPIIYAIAPPTTEPKAAAVTVGIARFLFAIIGGVIKTSGGTNKNTDSHTVIKNTNHEYMRVSDFFNINSLNFIQTLLTLYMYDIIPDEQKASFN